MATTEIHAIKSTLSVAIDYIINPDKTEEKLYVNSFGCSIENGKKASDEFEMVRKNGTGRGTLLAQHILQNFKPGEVEPEQAIEIGIQLANKLLKGEYQYVIATHIDKQHIHNHIIFNNVNFNGKSFEYLENKGAKVWQKLRNISDELCLENNLSVVKNPEKSKGKSWWEYQQHKQGLSWKSQLKNTIDEAIMDSMDFEEFLKNLNQKNVEYIYRPELKISLKFRLKNDGQEKWSRAKTLGWYYEPEQLKKRINNFNLLKTGKLNYTQKTKVLDTSSERFKNNFGLHYWAEIQNMKEASKMINFLTERSIKNQQELEQKSIMEYGNRMLVVKELNEIQSNIDELSDTIKSLKSLRKYKPIYEAYKNALFKKKFEKENFFELEKYKKASDELKEKYPFQKVIPNLEKLIEDREKLIEKSREKNEIYKHLISEIKELDYARQSIEDYLKTQKEIQKNYKEI